MAASLIQTLSRRLPRLPRLPHNLIPLARPLPIPLHRRTLMTLPSFSLEGKTCVVTGAGRGLGKEFLTAFALSGASGACVDLSIDAGNSAISSIRSQINSASPSSGDEAELRAYACDVTQETQVKDTWAQIVSDFGKVDVVLTAAGIVDNVEAENYEYERWRKMFDINLHGSFLFAKEAGKYWIEGKRGGNVILVSSMSSMVCVRPQKQAAYNASKGAVSMMGKSLCTEWAPYGIRVNNLCPGYMKTDLIIDLLKKEGSHIEQNWVKDIPMGRLGHPSELQGTVVWMASDASSYLNGSDILVDGGYCCY